MLKRPLGMMSIRLYRLFIRTRAKMFSILISGSFHKFGKRSVIQPPLRISGEARMVIGSGVFIGPNSWLLVMGDGDNHSPAIHIGDGVSAVGSLTISAIRSVMLEDQVLLAKNVYISDHMHRYSQIGVSVMSQGLENIEPVCIKKGAWIGQNVIICPGVTIGENAVVGANSVVNDSIPDFSLAVGAPAKVVKSLKQQNKT